MQKLRKLIVDFFPIFLNKFCPLAIFQRNFHKIFQPMNRNWDKMMNAAWEDHSLLKEEATQTAIREVIAALDNGSVRVAEKQGDQWKTNEWAKKAVLMYFTICPSEPMEAGPLLYYDKIKLKRDFEQSGVRAVPPSIARYGSFLNRGVILMASYINIGAYVDSGTLVDIGAAVGSCAQIGKNIHLSANVVVGGVLEPVQANPVIIEDGAFLGAKCVVVEGVHVGKEAVLGANVTITASTKIIDTTTKTENGEPKIYRGYVPPRSVVIPGSLPKEFPGGTYNVPCALIIGQRSEQTDAKVALNDFLRKYALTN